MVPPCQLNPSALAEFQQKRDPAARAAFCHAPARNLNFDPLGNVTACCYNRWNALGRYPERSIAELWRGSRIAAMRREMNAFQPPEGCGLCVEQVNAGNSSGSLARLFDSELTSGLWPDRMEFQISNRCNLLCEMCDGSYSSKIREYREKLPPLENPYGPAFIQELEEFIPYLSETLFLGGEPFLIAAYHEIWERMISLNPRISTAVVTNGTVLSRKIVRFLDRLPFRITVSIDSLNRERYERIRVGADYDKLRRNLGFFLGYSRLNGQALRIVCCPMQSNWMDVPELARYCCENRIVLSFNTVVTPAELSLRSLPSERLREIVDFLKRAIPAEHFAQDDPVARESAQSVAGLMRHLDYWAASAERNTPSWAEPSAPEATARF